MALASADEFRQVYPDLVAVGQDPVIQTAVSRADQLMAIWCGRPFADSLVHTLESTTYTLTPKPSAMHPRALNIGLRTVTAITTVHIDEDWVYGADKLVPSADYTYDLRRGLLWLKPTSGQTWSCNDLVNRVVLVDGFAAAPEAIKAVAIVQARYLLELDKLQGAENTTANYGSLTPTEAEALLAPGVMAALVPYIYWPSRLG